MLENEIQQILLWPLAIMSFVWGLIWGSFFNVCIYRIPARKSVVRPGSHCYSCGSPVVWYDNIPVLSYLMLRGCCRFCGTHFSARYMFVELLTGVLFCAAYLSFGPQWQTPFHMVFLGLLIIGTFTDIDHFIIPDRITLGGAVFAVIATGLLARQSFIADQIHLSRELWRQLTFQWDAPRATRHLSVWLPLVFSIFSAGFGYAMLWLVGLMGRLLFRKEAMGMGDVKLFAFLGAWMGPLYCIWILFVSAFVGALVGLSLLLAHKLVGKDEVQELNFEGQPTVKSQWLVAVSRLTGEGDAELLQVAKSAPQSKLAADQGLSVQIPLRTARQLHHFPYGPYIAIAAALLLLLHETVDEAVRTFFLLG